MEQQNIIISICMIMKNEERCLERCLKSLTPLREQLPCELIITDTGSTDRSIEIAEKYADKLLHFEWCNDFSAARNFGLEQAKGEWIMVIDADEELVEDVSHLVKFFTSEEKYKYYGCFLKKKNCFDAKICSSVESLKDYEGGYSNFSDFRVFRADMNPRYHGIIHEAVSHFEPTYTFKELVLYHDGYAFEDKSKRREKGVRNASLLEKQIKENLHDLRAITHVLREEDVLDKEVYKNLILLTEKLMYKNLRNIFAPYSFAKVASYYLERDKEKALKICKDYLRYYDDKNCELFEMDIRFIQAKCLFAQKQYQPTLKMINRYFELIDKYESEKMSLELLKTAAPMYVGEYVQENMKYLRIQCYVELKEMKTAGELLKQIDFKKVTGTGFFNFFVLVIRLNHFREANISLAEYYPILSRAMKGENERQTEAAKQVYDLLQKHINHVPERMRKAIFTQIAFSEEGKADLQDMIDKSNEEDRKKKENFQNAIANAKESIRELMKEENMKNEALDLAKQLEELAPEDEEVKEFIKVLSE